MMSDVGEAAPRFFGKFRAVVRETADPQRRGRVRALVPAVLGDRLSGWALPCLPVTGVGSGFFAVPPANARVWFEFESGDPDYPIWTGGFWGDPDPVGELPGGGRDDPPSVLVVRSSGGHLLALDDAGGGGIVLRSAGGAVVRIGDGRIELDAGGGVSIVLSDSGVSIMGDALEVRP